MVAQAVFLHGSHLPPFKAAEALQLCHALQELCLCGGIVGALAVIVQGSGRVFVGPRQQKRIQLGLGCGHGKNFNDVFLIGTLLHGGAAAHAGTTAHGRTQSKAIQKGGHEIGFRHFFRLLDSHIIK